MHSRYLPEEESGQYIRVRTLVLTRMTKGDAAVTRGARTPTTLPVIVW